MKNNCFECQQEHVHRQLLDMKMVSWNGFRKLMKLWHDCEHSPERTKFVK